MIVVKGEKTTIQLGKCDVGIKLVERKFDFPIIEFRNINSKKVLVEIQFQGCESSFALEKTVSEVSCILTRCLGA